MSTPFCVSPPNLAHRTKKHRKTCSKHRSPPLTSLPAVTPPHLMYSSVGPDDSVRPNTRLPHPHFVLILSFRASAHTGVGIRIPRPLPLPLGEVAERSEDGEGKQRRAASRRPFFQLVDKPILSFRGAPQGYLLRGAKRRGNPQSFSCKFAEKRKNCAIWEQIATPVCGLARNDRLFRQPEGPPPGGPPFMQFLQRFSTSRTPRQYPYRRRCTGWPGPSWPRAASASRAAG